jgi:hypothetical protein
MMVMLTLIVSPTAALMVGRIIGFGLVMSRRGLSGVLVHLALKDQGSYPDRLDYREDERSNEPCDECRK